MKYIPRWSL